MPQMFPMNWLFIYIIFIMIFMMYLIKIYFSFFQKMPNNKKMMNFKILKMNWKW
uniref:ATP synthase F0 subunit 8 n=1 Tax=Penicillidia jenynsii TaxID=1034756 RepID=UPI002E7A3B9B|nr:ATP synthase F0 subunit 8 [Penicillidia jenynsii]WRI60686.1 ATP synthase F0 subunit 8 [Penicillidia jenynsii]